MARTGIFIGLALALLAMPLVPQHALAQAYQCRMPRQLAPPGPVTPDGPARPRPVAGYTLAASWSPDWCKTHGNPKAMQCDTRFGRFGFILHGLWPEAARGPSPQWCAVTPLPRPQTLRKHLCMTPSPSLLVHEWAKHGSCMTKDPARYYRVSAILWRSVHWPDADRLSRKEDLKAGDVRDAFLARNQDWPRKAIGIHLSRKGWLQEVRLCYGADFRPRACDSRRLGARDDTAMKIWRGL